MNGLEVIQIIGSEICEECGDSRDCGLEYSECDRIGTAFDVLEKFLDENRELLANSFFDALKYRI